MMNAKQREAAKRLADALQSGADDPMWAHHAEIKKSTLGYAAALLRELLAEPDLTGDVAWLWTHCKAIGMTKRSYSGSMRDDVALYVTTLHEAATQAAKPVQEPVAHLYVGNDYGDELQDWEIDPEQGMCDKLNEQYYGNPQKLPIYTHPPQQRKPLTDEQVWADDGIMSANARAQLLMPCLMELVRAVERAHNIPGEQT